MNLDKGLYYFNSNYIWDGEYNKYVIFKGFGFRVE